MPVPPHRVAEVRPASPADLSVIADLRSDALAEALPQRGGELYVNREARTLPAGEDPAARVWAGVVEEEVVGYLTARIDDRLGKVDAIYVDPGCRAVGVGEALMAAALAWFRERDCVGADATALPGARATKNFFEESGFTARLLVMHRPL